MTSTVKVGWHTRCMMGLPEVTAGAQSGPVAKGNTRAVSVSGHRRIVLQGRSGEATIFTIRVTNITGVRKDKPPFLQSRSPTQVQS